MNSPTASPEIVAWIGLDWVGELSSPPPSNSSFEDRTPCDERLCQQARLRRGSPLSLVLESQPASREGGRKK